MLYQHKKHNESTSRITKNTMKNRLGSTEMHRTCFIPFSNTHGHSNFLRQYVLTEPLPFSKPAYIYAEIQPGYQCYL